ncbi:Cof-type HAD-IIB family hydrolase [Chloroflexota bacterium]
MTNNRYKLLVMDADGTIFGKNRSILPEDKEAVRRALEQGVTVSLSTGRTMLSALKILDMLSLDGFHIFCDGAHVSNPSTGEEIHCHPLNKELVREAIDFAHANNINLELFSTHHYFVERESWNTDIRLKFFGVKSTVVNFSDIWEREVIIKGTLVVSPEERDQADCFEQRFKGELAFSRTGTPAYPDIGFLNIVTPGVSKGKGLEALASHLDIPLSQIMAIGDHDNDIPLLTTAGFSVAMGNAIDEVKAIADHVTLDIEHAGVAAAIKKFLL